MLFVITLTHIVFLKLQFLSKKNVIIGEMLKNNPITISYLRLFLIVLLLCCGTKSLYSQGISANFNVEDSSKLNNSKFFRSQELKSEKDLDLFLKKSKINWIEKGFFLVSMQKKKSDSNHFEVSVQLGKQFKRINLEVESNDLWQLKRFGVPINKMKEGDLEFSALELGNFLKNGLDAYLNNGFPFATLSFENLEILDNQVLAKLKIEKGRIFSWTEIHIKGDSSITVNAIENIIGIQKGDLFNETALAQVDKRLSQVNFIKSLKPSEILFTEEGVELYLYLQGQKISSIQGAVGLQPNPVKQSVSLTGEFQMKLVNVFKKAELIDLNWRSIQPQTQSLNLKFVYPYLFKSPFGIDARFNLYKRDSTFLDIKSSIGILYTLKDGAQLKASYQFSSSNLLYGASNNTQFSNLSSVKTNAYGISYTRRKLDYIPNPSKGLSIFTEVLIGSRTSRKDSISDKKNVGRATIQIDKYFSIAKRHVLKVSAGFETYYAPQVFQNELYRFGGLNSLRGFNEDELYASTKLSTTLEYRFLVDKNSNAFVFYDQSFYENRAVSYKKDHPFGIGTGFSFGTKLGIFTISYAVGKQLSNPLDMRLSKIHFGYTAYF